MTKKMEPDLTFPDLTYGAHETQWNLRCILYEGASGINVKYVDSEIDKGCFTAPSLQRVMLVKKLHEHIDNQIGRGGRRSTAKAQIDHLKLFVKWVDDNTHIFELDSIERLYLLWTDSLLHRVRIGEGLSENSAYGSACVVGQLIDRVLGRFGPIVKTSRLKKKKALNRAVSARNDKQNLEETFAFGHFLLDVADGLSEEAIWGTLPIRIPLRNGKELVEWSGLKRPDTYKAPNPKYPHQIKYLAKESAKKRNQWESDRTLRTRYPVVNLRIMAEMLMLMAQPAVNLAQVYELRMDQWRFKPSIQGYEIRTYKHRKWGPVVFDIYSEYKKVFERYLKWRAAIFPEDPQGLLFPLIGRGKRADKPARFESLQERCVRSEIKYVSPSRLRNTNVNWMLRRTNDPELTASEKQHSVKTLLDVYQKPSQQKAMVQVNQFWAKHDPARLAAGPGSCVGKDPESLPDIPLNATIPDCKTPAGCLYCAHQRDIDSLDHVWSLASYRHLKSFELAGQRQPVSKKILHKPPALLAIERITAKLEFIKNSSPLRESWVDEALLRIDEGRHHPDWMNLF